MANGFDFAAVDGDGKIDAAAAHAAGADFAYLNASPGNSVFNQAPAFRAAGICVGPYLFPPIHATVDPAVWAGDVLTTVADVSGDLPVCLDVELPRGIAGTGMDRAGVAGWIRTALARLSARLAYKPLIYSSRRVLDTDDSDTLAGLLDDLFGPDGHPLWLAYYGIGPVACPKAAGPGNYWIHQDHGDVKGAFTVRQVDTDVFNYARIGETGPRVTWLQRRMGYSKAKADGVFGPKTRESVMNIQQGEGLTVDGIVRPRTFARLATAG